MSGSKKLTCWYFSKGPKGCIHTAEECKYSHSDTGVLAKCPAGMSDRKAHDSKKDYSVETDDDFVIWEIIQHNASPSFATLQSDNADIYGGHAFSLKTLRKILYCKNTTFPLEKLKLYLQCYRLSEVAHLINEMDREGAPPILFFAVATNSLDAVNLCLEYSADPNLTYTWATCQDLPLLAFTIMHGGRDRDTTQMTRLLLSAGADHSVIPEYLYSPHTSTENVLTSKVKKQELPPWCKQAKGLRALTTRLNLSQKYWLTKASHQTARTSRETQVGEVFGCRLLFRLPFSLIGQDIAIHELREAVLSHMLMTRENEPLVLLLAGPSGHGKTELARDMGRLLNRKFLAVDCTEIQHGTDCFGPSAPYQGYRDGSKLNNFLAQNSGGKCIVFLDEFEKMGGRDIYEKFLIIWDEGNYRDRRTVDSRVDARKVIWVLATNAADEVIKRFYSKNSTVLKGFSSSNEASRIKAQALVNQLGTSITQSVLKPTFGDPITGRITSIVPFFPFTSEEQAVMAHRYILETKASISGPIDITDASLVRHVSLHIEEDAKLCQFLVDNDGYDQNTGARSISKTVRNKVTQKVTREWMKSSRGAAKQSDNELPMEKYTVALRPVEDSTEEVVVLADK